MSSETQRYILDIEMYLYAKSDKKARKKVEKMIKKLKKKYLNSHARASELHLQPFATFIREEVSLDDTH